MVASEETVSLTATPMKSIGSAAEEPMDTSGSVPILSGSLGRGDAARTQGGEENGNESVLLFLTIHEAKDLVPMDRSGRADPYVVIRVGRKISLKTSVKKNTLTPQWNEDFEVLVEDPTDVVEIEMFDKNRVRADAKMGTVRLEVSDLLGRKRTNAFYYLDGAKKGQIRISANWVRY
eukprot:Rmarinus@m.3465